MENKIDDIINIVDFIDYLNRTEALVHNYTRNLILFRGQSEDKAILPAIARNNPKNDTTKMEIEMLSELKRRSEVHLKKEIKTDWDWLTYAQHFGMKTRLLDWSSNPLVALWFACKDDYFIDTDAYVYVLLTENNLLLTDRTENPFELKTTRVLRPSFNNNRIIAQSGWFTSHCYASKLKKFISLENNTTYKERFWKLIIPSSEKKDILKKLSVFGVNYQFLFPDIEGVCKQINMEFKDK